MNSLIYQLNLTLDSFDFDLDNFTAPSYGRRSLRGISFLSNDGDSGSGFNYSLSMFGRDENNNIYFDMEYMQRHQILPPYSHNKPTDMYHLVERNFKKISELGIELFRARLSMVAPGATIPPHQDSSSVTDYCLKLHIPVKTNPQAKFVFGDQKFHLQQDRAYIVNVAPEHAFENLGTEPRYHVMADCIVTNPELPFYCKNYDRLINYYRDWERLVTTKDTSVTRFVQSAYF